jgi:hypothetical protein
LLIVLLFVVLVFVFFVCLGGGAAGAKDRAPTTALACKVCKTPIHNLTIMKNHYEAKHAAATFNPADYS